MPAVLHGVAPALLWMGAGALLLVAEVLSGSGWLLWAAASAGVTALAVGAVPGLSPAAALSGFAALTLVSTALARRYLPRRPPADAADINDRLGRLVGHRGRAVGAFREGAGRVFIDGKEWAAEQEGPVPPEPDAGVVVTGVTGVHLKVRPA